MQISPLVPILCLLAGALVFELGALVRLRWLGLVSVVATGTATAAMLFLARRSAGYVGRAGLAACHRLWLDSQPCVWTKTAWLLGVALLLTSLSVTLVWLAVPRPQTLAHG